MDQTALNIVMSDAFSLGFGLPVVAYLLGYPIGLAISAIRKT